MTSFVKSPKNSYKRRIDVKIPGDYGKIEESVSFDIELPRRNRAALLARLQALPEGDDNVVIDEVLGWSGLNDSDGKPVEFNAGNLRKVCEIDCYFEPIFQAVLENLKLDKVLEAGRKN